MAEETDEVGLAEFLVSVNVTLPATLEPEIRSGLLARELARGRELRHDGTIYRIWRLPGGIKNVAIWRAPNATVLHEMLASLPLFNYAHIEVTALAKHPVES